MEKRFEWKFWTVIGLIALIVIGLFYLVLARGFAARPTAAATASASTAAPAVTASPEPTASATATAAPNATPAAVDLNTVSSLQKLVNVDHQVDSSYVPDDLTMPNVTMDNPQQLRKEAASALEDLFAAAESADIHLKLISGYRSYTEQVSLWYTYAEKFGTYYTNRIDSHPGYSEHQLGLAADLGNADGSCELYACFAKSSASSWLEEHAWQYGYILRYPENGEASTKLMYLPWHYRYVGKSEAEKIHASGKTMEEYYNQPIGG